MPYPAQGLYPSSLLYPLEAGVEFVNFTKDFKRLVDRYGRALKNSRTNLSFHAILNILSGAKCIGDNRTMKCGDAIAYVLPSSSYEIGDHITPVSGRGEWVIVTERYASRIGDLRVFRALGLERYTPNTTLTGVYAVLEPAIVGIDFVGAYALVEDLVWLEMLSRYDISSLTISEILFVGKYNLIEELASLDMLSRYDVNALDVPGIVLGGRYGLKEELIPLEILSEYGIIALDGAYPATTLYPSTSLYPRGPGRAIDIMSAEFVAMYDIAEERISLDMLSRYDVNALDVPGIVLASKYELREELISLEMIGSYDLTEELISLDMLSRYDINALEAPAIVLASKYELREELLNSEMMSRYGIISKEVRKVMVSSYDITKTPAQITGERTYVDAQNIDNYWNPWNDDDLSYYKVHRSLINGFTPSDANLVGIPSSDSFKHSNLTAATQYYFKVCAVTKLGVSGTYSAQFTATTA